VVRSRLCLVVLFCLMGIVADGPVRLKYLLLKRG